MATVREREQLGVCPACGGGIVEGEKSYYCLNYKSESEGGKECKVFLPKLIMGQTFDKGAAAHFFKANRTDVMAGMTKEGKEVEFSMEYDGEEKKIVPRFVNSGGGKEPLGNCPKCGKGVFEGKKSYYCSGYKDEPACDFSLWKETEGAKFDAGMIKQMLNKEELKDVSCFTKDGKEYKCGFKVSDEGNLVKISYGGQK